MTGANGSCRWTTSIRGRRTAWAARTAATGETAIGATEPLARTPMERPTVTTWVEACGGPGATTITSWPSARRARLSPVTWPWTPPGIPRSYGDTIAIRTAGASVPAAGQLSLALARPQGLEHVPLLGRPLDVLLEVPRDLLGDAGHVLPERAGPGGVNGRRHVGQVVGARPREHGGRDQHRPGAQRQRCRAGREGRHLAEELDLDPVADEVSVTQEADEPPVAQHLDHLGARVLVERHDIQPRRVALLDEPPEELRRLQDLGDRSHAIADALEPRATPLPTAHV